MVLSKMQHCDRHKVMWPNVPLRDRGHAGAQSQAKV